jgi:beta-glucanase (GH16 family)
MDPSHGDKLIAQGMKMTQKPFGCEEAQDFTLIFEDHFEGEKKDWEKNWKAASQAFGHILCSRWPENVEQEDSLLKLINRKESRGGQDWTSGSVQTHQEFLYGYYECRYRYAPCTGLNQSFWIMTNPAYSAGKETFELDINEGHWPGEVATNYHYMKDGIPLEEKGLHVYDNSNFIIQQDLSEDFHIYGCLWTKDVIAYYFDGVCLRQFVNTFAHVPAPVRLSSAIVSWAGKVKDDIHNTFTAYDYVRIFRRSR